jgi:hypothetical protein
VVSGGRENRIQSELELMGLSPKTGDSIMEQSRTDCRPDVDREIHIRKHCCSSFYYYHVIAVTCL